MKIIDQNSYTSDTFDSTHEKMISYFVSDYKSLGENLKVIFTLHSLPILRSAEAHDNSKPMAGIPFTINPHSEDISIYILNSENELVEEYKFENVSFG